MFIKSNKCNTEWHKRFLWFPVRGEDGYHWLKFVERHYVVWLDRELLLKDKPYRYRLIKINHK